MKDHGLSMEELRTAEYLDGVPNYSDPEPKTRLTFAGRIRGVDVAIEGTGEEVIRIIESVVASASKRSDSNYTEYKP